MTDSESPTPPTAGPFLAGYRVGTVAVACHQRRTERHVPGIVHRAVHIHWPDVVTFSRGTPGRRIVVATWEEPCTSPDDAEPKPLFRGLGLPRALVRVIRDRHLPSCP